ncbi:hypothetical protein ADK70_12310 [Streptomyces rimosus subsp. pseudoverticillatus]|nr:hypothetical protein ADK70_12310 [Streptomyces rimosus subsp. pseudoverticillatus]
MSAAEEALRAQVRAALAATRISQAEACRQLGLSTKHMNMMLTGKATFTLDWAERIADLCGKRIEVLVLTGRLEKIRAQSGHAENSPAFWGYIREADKWSDAASEDIGL